MARLIATALAALGIAVTVAACGGSGTSGSSASTAQVSATAYVTALCDAVGPFEKQVAAFSPSLKQVASESPSRGKAVLVSFLSGISADSSHAASRLRAAGIPSVSGGASFAKAILDTFTRLQGTLTRSEKVAQQLSTTSKTSFESGAHELALGVQDSVGDIGKGLSKQSSSALNTAAAKVAACHSI